MRFLGDDLWAMTVDGREIAVQLFDFEAGGESASGQVRLAIDDLQRNYRVAVSGESCWVSSMWGAREVIRLPRYPQPAETAEGETANAPMPGQVLKILVEVGERVEAGAPLLILEAMKMEQLIRAALEGTVEAVLVKPGDIVGPGDVLIEIR
jgi:biotin carboxyl carrier protein